MVGNRTTVMIRLGVTTIHVDRKAVQLPRPPPAATVNDTQTALTSGGRARPWT